MIPKSVAGAVFSHDGNSILLIKRRDVPVWVLPGGGIDAGESPERAIVREILEETGFHVFVELKGMYTPINRLAKETFLYRCDIIEGKPTPSCETSAVAFFPLSKLPLMPPPYLEWIEDAQLRGEVLQKQLTCVNYATLIKLLLLHPVLVFRFFLSRLGIPLHD